MISNLPPEFVKTIDTLLKDDAVQFWQAFSLSGPTIGLRINPEKTEIKTLKKALAADYTSLPWEENGFLYHGAEGLGKHPYHAAGMYYLQEPSAMAPVAILDPQPGERVLDLCAAPGGKTTQIHSRMIGEGIIIANDPNPHRVQALGLKYRTLGSQKYIRAL